MKLEEALKLSKEYTLWECGSIFNIPEGGIVAWVDARKAADDRLRTHCRRHFMEALAALKETQELYRALVSAHKIRGGSKSGVFEDALDTRSDANVKLIAKLEEVK